MAIPSVNMFSNQPGGGLNVAMRANNSLANEMLLRQMNQIKKQYLPLTSQAEAASKLAYANLMAPQFLAKIMGNDSALANMSEEQKKAALDKIYQAGTGQGTGNAFNQMPQAQQGDQGGIFSGIGQPSTNSLSGWIANKLKNSFGGSSSASQQPPMQQGGIKRPADGVSLEGQQWYNNKGEPVYANEKAQEPQVNPMEMDPNQAQIGQRQPTYAENTGTLKGIVEEGKEAGKIRAKDIEQLNNTVFNAETAQTTLDDLSGILSSPAFEQIRQVPLLGHHELSYYAKEGKPEQQQLVGRYYTDTGNIIKDSARDFAGQFRKGEQQLLTNMKANPSDTVDTARGKVESLAYFNKMLAERSRLTSKYMTDNHINKLQASEMADRRINGEDIRKQIRDKLNPMITIKNKKTGEQKTISVSEARKLGVPNV